MNRALVPVRRTKPSFARRLAGDLLSIAGILVAALALLAFAASTCARPADSKEPARFSTHCEPLGDTDATICETHLPGLRTCISVIGGMDVPALTCND